MQNTSGVLTSTLLLALDAFYTLDFDYFSSQFENEAQMQGVYEAEQLLADSAITEDAFDATAAEEAKAYLRAKGDSAIVPVFGKTYKEAKERELNLGLLLGGDQDGRIYRAAVAVAERWCQPEALCDGGPSVNSDQCPLCISRSCGFVMDKKELREAA